MEDDGMNAVKHAKVPPETETPTMDLANLCFRGLLTVISAENTQPIVRLLVMQAVMQVVEALSSDSSLLIVEAALPICSGIKHLVSEYPDNDVTNTDGGVLDIISKILTDSTSSAFAALAQSIVPTCCFDAVVEYVCNLENTSNGISGSQQRHDIKVLRLITDAVRTRPCRFGEGYLDFMQKDGCLRKHPDPEMKNIAIAFLHEMIANCKDSNFCGTQTRQRTGDVLLLYARHDPSIKVKQSALRSLLETQRSLDPKDCAQYLERLSHVALRQDTNNDDPFRRLHQSELVAIAVANIAEIGKGGASPDVRRQCCDILLEILISQSDQESYLHFLRPLLVSITSVIISGKLEEDNRKYCFEFLHDKILHHDNHHLRRRVMNFSHQLDCRLPRKDLTMRLDFLLHVAASDRSSKLRRIALNFIKLRARYFASYVRLNQLQKLGQILEDDEDLQTRQAVLRVIDKLSEVRRRKPPTEQFSLENRKFSFDMLLKAARSNDEATVRIESLRLLGSGIVVKDFCSNEALWDAIHRILVRDDSPLVRKEAAVFVGRLAMNAINNTTYTNPASTFIKRCYSFLLSAITDADNIIRQEALRLVASSMALHQRDTQSNTERIALEKHQSDAIMQLGGKRDENLKVRIAALDLLGHIAVESQAQTCRQYCQCLVNLAMSQTEEIEIRKQSWRALATAAKGRPENIQWLLPGLLEVWTAEIDVNEPKARPLLAEIAGVVGYAALGAEGQVLEKSCEHLLQFALSKRANMYLPIERPFECLAEMLLKAGQGELFNEYFQKFLDYSSGFSYQDHRCCAIRCLGTIAIRTNRHDVHQQCLEHLVHVARYDKQYKVQVGALFCLERVVKAKLESWALISLKTVSEIVCQSRDLSNAHEKHGIMQAVLTLIDAVTASAASNSDIIQGCMKVLLGENMGSIDQEQAMAAVLETLNARPAFPFVMFYEIARCEDVTSVVRGMALDCMCKSSVQKCNKLLLDLAQNSSIDVSERAAELYKQRTETASRKRKNIENGAS